MPHAVPVIDSPEHVKAVAAATRELNPYCLGPCWKAAGLMSVATNLRETIKIAQPVPILTTAYYRGLTVLSRSGTYEVASDGGRFLMIKDVDDSTAVQRTQIVVERNWIEELKGLVPAKR